LQAQRPIATLPPSDTPRPKVAGPAVQSHLAQPKPSPLTPKLLQQFSKGLGLTAAQREKIHPIVGRAGEDLQRLRDEELRRRQDNVADVSRVNERMYADVSGVLTPEQRVKLQDMRQRFEDRVKADKLKRAEAAAAADAAYKASLKADKAPEKPASENPK
jgi:Spy/CpxP family protein refolding chaperone